jgi:hypothetical protein
MSFPQQPTHTRVEFEVEPEPVLIESAPNLFLPESWVEERRSAFAARWAPQYVVDEDRVEWSLVSGNAVRVIKDATLLAISMDSK